MSNNEEISEIIAWIDLAICSCYAIDYKDVESRKRVRNATSLLLSAVDMLNPEMACGCPMCQENLRGFEEVLNNNRKDIDTKDGVSDC